MMRQLFALLCFAEPGRSSVLRVGSLPHDSDGPAAAQHDHAAAAQHDHAARAAHHLANAHKALEGVADALPTASTEEQGYQILAEIDTILPPDDPHFQLWAQSLRDHHRHLTASQRLATSDETRRLQGSAYGTDEVANVETLSDPNFNILASQVTAALVGSLSTDRAHAGEVYAPDLGAIWAAATSSCSDERADHSDPDVACEYSCAKLRAEFFPEQEARCFLFVGDTFREDGDPDGQNLLDLRVDRLDWYHFLYPTDALDTVEFSVGNGRSCTNVTFVSAPMSSEDVNCATISCETVEQHCLQDGHHQHIHDLPHQDGEHWLVRCQPSPPFRTSHFLWSE
eukprot:COSAG02_NODE_4_length_69935_cov_46.806590_62_plen_341_part_00